MFVCLFVCFCLVVFTFLKSKYENNLNPYQVLLGMYLNITLRFGHLIGFVANTNNLGRKPIFSASFFFLRLITGKNVSILGGWTAIKLISFTGSNLWFENTTYSASSYRNLTKYNDRRLKVPSRILMQLKTDMGFKQLRFYCHKQKVGTVFHIMTNDNHLGEAVVKYFIDNKLISSRPQACGSYTVLPDDNSTLSQNCKKLGWNGTHADGKWTRFSKGTGDYRVF